MSGKRDAGPNQPGGWTQYSRMMSLWLTILSLVFNFSSRVAGDGFLTEQTLFLM